MNKTQTKFEGLLSEYFEGVLQDNPTYATVVGLSEGEGKLGTAGLEFEQRQENRRRRTLARLETLSPRDLTNEQHVDRLALRSQLLHGSEDFQRGRHRLEPNALDHVLNILLHELIRSEDEPKRAARNVRSLLDRAPQFLDQAVTLIDRPEPVWRKIMEQTAAGAPSLLEAVKTFLGRVEPAPGDIPRIAATQKSISKYRDKVSGRPPAKEGSFAVGASMLQRRVRDELGLDYTLGEIEALAQAEVARVGSLLHDACRKLAPRKQAEEIIGEARSRWEPGTDLVAMYRAQTKRLVAAFKSAQAVSFPPNESLEVRLVPEFMRHLFPTAAYSQPGALEKRQRGIFWVNDLSVTKKTETEKRWGRSLA